MEGFWSWSHRIISIINTKMNEVETHPIVLLYGTLQKVKEILKLFFFLRGGRQLVDVAAAKMLINCRLCPYFCTKRKEKTPQPNKEQKRRGAVCMMAKIFFFLLLLFYVLHPTANHLPFFILLTWILLYFIQKQEKNEHLCLFPICCTSACFDAGLQSSVSNPRTLFIFLLKCLLLYPMLMPLRVYFFPLFLSLSLSHVLKKIPLLL